MDALTTLTRVHKTASGFSGSQGRSSASPRGIAMEKPLVLLAIDDDPDSLELIRSALSQPGLEIYTEEDPERGLELVEQLQPQIVLVDLMMPKLSGMDILDRTLQTA